VAQVWSGTTPFTIEHREVFDGAPAFLRLEVRSSSLAYILSNPIFLRPAGAQ